MMDNDDVNLDDERQTHDEAAAKPNVAFHPALMRKLLASGIQELRLSPMALVHAGALVRLFVHEAHKRASIEAECETEGDMIIEEENDKKVIAIEPHHISKVAAELLMDFA